MDWIKISDKWPDNDSKSIVYYDGENVFVAYFDDEYVLLRDPYLCPNLHCKATDEEQIGCDCIIQIKPYHYWLPLPVEPHVDQPERASEKTPEKEMRCAEPDGNTGK